jgi:hypothetical protein
MPTTDSPERKLEQLAREQAIEFTEHWFQRKWMSGCEYQSLMEKMVERLMPLLSRVQLEEHDYLCHAYSGDKDQWRCSKEHPCKRRLALASTATAEESK